MSKGGMDSGLLSVEEQVERSDRMMDLQERLRQLQEELRTVRAELVFRSDELRSLEQKKSAQTTLLPSTEPSIPLSPHATSSPLLTDTLSSETKSQNVRMAHSKGIISSILTSFVNRQIAHVYSDKYRSQSEESNGVADDYFQVEVYADKQVCSLKVSSECTFRELLVHVANYWRIDRQTVQRLVLVDGEGAVFLAHMKVKGTMSLFSGTKGKIMLRHRPVPAFDLFKSFEPQKIADRVKRMKRIREQLEARKVHDNKPAGESEMDEMQVEDDDMEKGEKGMKDTASVSTRSSSLEDEEDNDLGIDLDLILEEAFDEAYAANKDKKDSANGMADEKRVAHSKRLVFDCVLTLPPLLLILITVTMGVSSTFFLHRPQLVESMFYDRFADYRPDVADSRREVPNLMHGAEFPFQRLSSDSKVSAYISNSLSRVMFFPRCFTQFSSMYSCSMQEYNNFISEIRYRQVRVLPEESSFVFEGQAFPSYASSRRDEREIELNSGGLDGFDLVGSPTEFLNPEETNGAEWAETATFTVIEAIEAIATYDPTGFSSMLLNVSGSERVEYMRNLTRDGWFGSETRGVFVDFYTMNWNTGSVVQHTFLFQKNPEGSFIPIYSPKALPIALFVEKQEIPSLLWGALFALGLFLLAVADLTQLWVFQIRQFDSIHLDTKAKRQRCGTCKRLVRSFRLFSWYTLDVLIFLSGVASFVLYIVVAYSSQSEEARDNFVSSLNSFSSLWSFQAYARAIQSLLGIILLLGFLRICRVFTVFQSGERLFTAMKKSFSSVFSLGILVYVPLILGLTTFLYVVFGPYLPKLAVYEDDLIYLLRLEMGFSPTASLALDHWSIFLTFVVLVLFCYFASMLVYLVVIETYSTVCWQKPQTVIRSVSEWYDIVKTLFCCSSRSA